MSVQKETFLRIHPHDNVLVALQNLEQGTQINFEGNTFTLADRIAAKHKFAINELKTGQEIYMYGVLVGKTTSTIPQGGLLSTQNVHHASDGFRLGERKLSWHQPDTRSFDSKTFNGYHRADGSVGTANYWIVVPLVFCENRNINRSEERRVGKEC